MPLIKDLVEGKLNVFMTSLAFSPLLFFYLPLTGLTSSATILLYLYLRHEHLINRSLARCTPPSPDAHLPLRREWIAKGGLKKLHPLTSDSDTICIVCLGPPTKPTQIAPCEHIFCAECIEAWQSQGNRSCPQCTTLLWRGGTIDYSQLERLVKFTAAAGLVGIPTTIFAIYCCISYFVLNNPPKLAATHMVPLLVFTALAILVLMLIWGALKFMLERRQHHGLNWWGDGVDEETELAWRMSLSMMSLLAGCWLFLVLTVCEAYLGTFTPILRPVRAALVEGGKY